jgi:hypothetical protein
MPWDRMRVDARKQILEVLSVVYLIVLPSTDCKPGSSVSIVSGYGLDDRTVEVRSPAEAK